MNYEASEKQDRGYVSVALCRQSVRSEISGDYTLPDYRPEIRRLLHVSAAVVPPQKYVGGSRVELDGAVDYQILYVGADGELYSAPLTGEYALAVPMDGSDADLGEGVCVMAASRAEAVTPRVTGPRRLSLRTRLCTEVSVFGKRALGERMSGEVLPESLCVLHADAPMADFLTLGGEEVTVTEEIEGFSDDVRVVSADAGALVSEATVRDGEAVLSGEVRLCLLCAYPDGRMETLRRHIPFSGRAEGDGELPEGLSLRARCHVGSLAVNGEEGRLSVEAHLFPEVSGAVNETLSYRRDLFSTQCPCEQEYAQERLPVHLRSAFGNLSQSERLPLGEVGISEGTHVLGAYGSAVIENSEWREGRYHLTGQSRYVLICERDGEYSTAEVLVPFRYTVDGAPQEAVSYSALARVAECHARISGDTLELDAELSLDGMWLGESEIRYVESVSFFEPVARTRGEMILCYPAPEETRWDVAKRYRVPPDAISGDPTTDPYVVI